jgi:hypothetical protein
VTVVTRDTILFVNAFLPKPYWLGQIIPKLGMARNAGAFLLLGKNLSYKSKEKRAERKKQ